MIPGTIPVEFSHALLITGSRSWGDEPAMRAAFNDLWVVQECSTSRDTTASWR